MLFHALSLLSYAPSLLARAPFVLPYVRSVLPRALPQPRPSFVFAVSFLQV